jgi:hypothetical protein
LERGLGKSRNSFVGSGASKTGFVGSGAGKTGFGGSGSDWDGGFRPGEFRRFGGRLRR